MRVGFPPLIARKVAIAIITSKLGDRFSYNLVTYRSFLTLIVRFSRLIDCVLDAESNWIVYITFEADCIVNKCNDLVAQNIYLCREVGDKGNAEYRDSQNY